jgi:hypothetical protein
MAEETAKDTETIRVVYFDGTDKTKWREWKIKSLAIGKVKGWKKAFLVDCQITKLELKDDADKTAEDKANIKANDNAWSYLMMACKSKAFNIVAAVQNDDAYMAFSKLKIKYEPNRSKDLVGMLTEWSDLKMEDEFEDPTIYIKGLEEINVKFESVDPKYKKTDLEMITYIFAKMPQSYSPVMTARELIGFDLSDLDEVANELEDYWTRYIKKSEKKIATEALAVEKGKKFFKKFKGICNYCGKQGHKETDCRGKAKDKGTGNGKQEGGKPKRDISKIKCFGCNEMGHYKSDCPKKDSNDTTASSLFVGAIDAVEPEEEEIVWNFTGVAKSMFDEENEWTTVVKKNNKKCKCVVKKHSQERCASMMPTFKREVQKTANVFDTCHDSDDSDDDSEDSDDGRRKNSQRRG